MSNEGISGPKELEDEVFLGYFETEGDGNERPKPAPRRIARMYAGEGRDRLIPAPKRVARLLTENREAMPTRRVAGAGQKLESEIGRSEVKSGKKAAIAEVRGFHIPLSTDSQGRDLLFIPPGSDGFSMKSKFNIHEKPGVPIKLVDARRSRAREGADASRAPNTPPQYQAAEKIWYCAGPDFQRGRSRFCTYNNEFDAGVVLSSFTDRGSFGALKHSRQP